MLGLIFSVINDTFNALRFALYGLLLYYINSSNSGPIQWFFYALLGGMAFIAIVDTMNAVRFAYLREMTGKDE